MSDISNDVSMSPKVIAAIGATKSAAKGGVSALANLASSFQGLLQGVGLNMGNGFEALADHDFTGNTVRDDAPRADDEYSRRPDNGEDQRSASARSDYGDNDRSQVEPTERRDDYGRDHGGGHREDRADGGGQEHGGDHGDYNAGDQGDDSVSRNDGTQGDEDTAPNENNDAETAEAGGETDDSESGSQTAENGENTNGADTTTANSGVNVQALTPDLAALVGGSALTADGQASDQGKTSAASGLATATQNIQKAASGAKGDNGATGNSTQGQTQAQTNADGKAITNANTHSALKGETQNQSGATVVQNQAAGLAKAMGDGVRTQVNVSVTNEAQTLTSRPGQALIADAAVSAKGGETGSGQTGTGTQGAGTSQSSAQGQQAGGTQNHSQPQTQGQQAQSGLTQAQANAQGQGQQGQVLEQVASGAKGGIGSITAAGASGGTSHAGGGEGATNTGTGPASASEQAQQAQKAADAKNADRPALNRPVAEQISVRITKAVQAGKDRINIQLRPANMGRVEVKMEISQDGRLTAIVIADRPETLEQLKNDSRDLERALEDAGLQAQSGDLTFNLRGEQDQENEGNDSFQDSASQDEDAADLENTIIEQPVIASDGSVISNGRIDVRA